MFDILDREKKVEKGKCGKLINLRKKGNDMRKTVLILLVALMLLALPASAWGYNTPAVSKGHGVVYGMFTSDSHILIGGEYGFTPDLAIAAALEKDIKIALKYELSPSLAILGGVTDSSPFIGLNGGTALSRDFYGMGEVDFTVNNSKVNFLYNLGLKYNLAKNLDLRGGLHGNVGDGQSQVSFGLGVGLKY